MALAPLPEEILDRFRTSSRNRLAQIEAAWQSLAQGIGDDESAREMQRNVHTLKGDARMVQFQDIDLVCQKLEDLLSVAHSCNYQVSSDLDLMVTMALDFIGLLLRRRGDQQVAAINLQGFVAQVHQVLRQESAKTGRLKRITQSDLRPVESTHASLTEGARMRLGAAATNVFLEYISATGAARTRLRSAWASLSSEIQRFDSLSATPTLQRHARAVPTLAEELGVVAGVDLDLRGELRLCADALHALDVTLTHGIRNALSHGIEAPDEREARGKARSGTIKVIAEIEEGRAHIEIRDDGRGLDWDLIRRRAIECGAMHPDVAGQADAIALAELLFQPQFSTRNHVDEFSGRGIGLDALRSAVRKVRGQVELSGDRHRGARLRVCLPLVERHVEVYVFDAFGGRMAFAVTDDWEASWRRYHEGDRALDPMASLQIRRPDDETGLMQSGLPDVIRLERDGFLCELIATKSGRRARALRICPTSDSSPAEVLTVDGAEVLWIRPDRLPAPVTEPPSW